MRSVLLTFLVLLPGIAGAQIPVLNVSTARLSFITSGTSQFPPSQQVRIRNTGSGSLLWRATTSTPWLRLSPGEGSAPGTLTVTLETARLAVGDYNGRITVSAIGDADDSPATIDVSLKLVAASKAPPEPAAVAPPAQPTAPGRPEATPQVTENTLPQVKLSAPTGSRIPVTSTVEIGAPPGSRSLAWTAKSDQRWLTVEPARGTTPATVTLKASPTGLPPGEARATVQFVDSSGTPLLVVPVILTVGRDAEAGTTTSGLSVSAATLPPATRNLPYGQAIPVRGGTPPYSVQVLQGRLPPGLVLANGAISGVSRVPGAYQFVLGVMDSSTPPQKVAQQMSLRVIAIYQDTALMVAPPAVSIVIVGNQRQQPVRLNISSGGQPLDWHATTDAAWLKLIPSDGVSPGILQLDVVTQGLAAGSYMATVTVMMEGVPNSPARIPAQLLVRK